MKILFDQNLSPRQAVRLPDTAEVKSARRMGWSAKRNGELLQLAAEHGFDAVVTLDQQMQHQQNPLTLPLPVIVLAPQRQTEEAIGRLLETQVSPLLEQGMEKRFYRLELEAD